jgi:hypothetical protein
VTRPELASLDSLGVAVPDVLIPAPHVDLARWAVVACDQYTSQPGYWKAVEERVGDAPSALRLILPELEIGASDEAARVRAIHAAMRGYLAQGVFAPPLRGFVSVERTTPHVALRRGLLVALDLERYDWRPEARALVRASEATVEERLPPRVRVREGAALELPHVLVLIDDPKQTVIEPAARAAATRAPLYDTPLEPDSGRVRGFAITGDAELAAIARALAKLAGAQPFLYAVGDGNHSLAAAKVCWERKKATLDAAARERDPARFALVELVNVHDPGLRCEPIHRLVFDVEPDALLRSLPQTAPPAKAHELRWRAGTRSGVAWLPSEREPLAVAALQAFLDAWLPAHPGARLDYIHGDDALAELASAPRRVGFFLPPFDKSALFPTVATRGVLPRKAFSLGEAEEKRFYLEAREIEGSER